MEKTPLKRNLEILRRYHWTLSGMCVCACIFPHTYSGFCTRGSVNFPSNADSTLLTSHLQTSCLQEPHLSQPSLILQVLCMLNCILFFKSFLPLHFLTDCSIQIHPEPLPSAPLTNPLHPFLNFYIYPPSPSITLIDCSLKGFPLYFEPSSCSVSALNGD